MKCCKYIGKSERVKLGRVLLEQLCGTSDVIVFNVILVFFRAKRSCSASKTPDCRAKQIEVWDVKC